jgi:hypothetical protein
MKTFAKFVESKRTNKFSFPWQYTRLSAKEFKDVYEKVDYVLDFLNNNSNIHNYNRVMNWLSMTALGYPKGSIERQEFLDTKERLESQKDLYTDLEDSDNDLTKIPTPDLESVWKDLKKRKNNFMHGGVPPKDQIDFMKNLEQELQKRK